MTDEEALALVKKFLYPEIISNIQQIVFRQSWAGKSYVQIASHVGYHPDYIKRIGFKLWQLLSNKLGKKVTKKTIHSVLQEICDSQRVWSKPVGEDKQGEPPLLREQGRKELQQESLSVQSQGCSRNGSRNSLSCKSLPTTYDHTHSQSAKELQRMTHFASSSVVSVKARASQTKDWGDALATDVFSGRTEEITTLEEWIVQDRCRLVVLLGMGGIGKTALAVKLAQQIQPQFDFLIWRSLRNAPPVADLLAELIQFLSQQQQIVLPSTVDARISGLIYYLRSSRCLLILDNVESILRQGDRNGRESAGYQGYDQMLRSLGETPHQSAVVLTSREKPRGLVTNEGEKLPVRSFQLTGIPALTLRQVLQSKCSLLGTESEWTALAEHYGGNPLLLKMVAPFIRDFFDNSVSKFLDSLRRGPLVFDDVRNLLEQQFARLSDLAKNVMYLLALRPEPISISQLNLNLLTNVRRREILEALADLKRRSLLIEQTPHGFMLPPVLVEYITEKLALSTKTWRQDYNQESDFVKEYAPKIRKALALLGIC